MKSNERQKLKYVEVTESFFELSHAEQRSLLRRLLNGLSQDGEVHDSAMDPSVPSDKQTDGNVFPDADAG